MPKTNAFKKLKRNVKKTYLGKQVPFEYRGRYGFRYDEDEITPLSYSIAKSKGILIDKKKRK
jgi:hypothetical protein